MTRIVTLLAYNLKKIDAGTWSSLGLIISLLAMLLLVPNGERMPPVALCMFFSGGMLGYGKGRHDKDR